MKIFLHWCTIIFLCGIICLPNSLWAQQSIFVKPFTHKTSAHISQTTTVNPANIVQIPPDNSADIGQTPPDDSWDESSIPQGNYNFKEKKVIKPKRFKPQKKLDLTEEENLDMKQKNSHPQNNMEYIGKDIRDYISEFLITTGEYNLISDDDIKNLGEDIEKKMLFGACETNECIRDLMKALDTDNILYGTFEFDDNKVMNITGILLNRRGGSVKKSITIKREKYLERGCHALVQYLLTRKEMYINRFYEEMDRQEKDHFKTQQRWQAALRAKDEAYESKLACLQHSPIFRIGYGGFTIKEYPTSITFDKKYNKYYENTTTITADFFLYRSRDIVGDGVDIYTRLFYKDFKPKENAYEDIAKDMASQPVQNYDAFAAFYNPLPEDKLQMIHRGWDVGVRFAGTTYFLWEAWTAYLMIGGRFVDVEEKYVSSNKEHKRKFNAFGFAYSLGIEMTLNRYFGLFCELSGGYTQIGENKVNIDGIQLLVGCTIRFRHLHYSSF